MARISAVMSGRPITRKTAATVALRSIKPASAALSSSPARRTARRFPSCSSRKPKSLATLGERIEVGSTVHADEATHWDALHSRYLTKRINHQWAYSDEGACTNDAESFFSRLRRAEIGIHHHIAGPYLGGLCRRDGLARG